MCALFSFDLGCEWTWAHVVGEKLDGDVLVAA